MNYFSGSGTTPHSVNKPSPLSTAKLCPLAWFCKPPENQGISSTIKIWLRCALDLSCTSASASSVLSLCSTWQRVAPTLLLEALFCCCHYHQCPCPPAFDIVPFPPGALPWLSNYGCSPNTRTFCSPPNLSLTQTPVLNSTSVAQFMRQKLSMPKTECPPSLTSPPK